MMSPANRASNASPSSMSFIHAFGYHFAKKMLGDSQVNECIQQARQLLEQDQVDTTFHCFRANWRSNARFPWQLPNIRINGSGDQGRGSEETLETLFVDITFDFMIFPIDAEKGGTHCYHVLREEDQGANAVMEEVDSISIAVAINIGALVAIPSSHVDKGDGYRYCYLRDKTLTVSDLEEHCRGIDIVLEEMEPAAVAHIIGDAFGGGCIGKGSKPLQVMVQNGTADNSSELSTIEHSASAATTNQTKWYLRLHHKSLDLDGLLPLSKTSLDAAESIGACMLDGLLLQSSNDSSGRANFTAVPTAVACMFWKYIDPFLVKMVEKPVEPSPKKMSPVRKVITMEENSSGIDKAAAASNDANESKPKSNARRLSKPQETALYARGKRTTLGGSRRKKPKFTFGPA
ncbi:hypothetical protein ACHAWF_016276 [Thalassiosira exigua]